MSTCHHCSFHWLRQPWQSSQQPAVQQRYPDELFAPLFESFLLELKVIGWAWWFSKHLFSYFSLQLAFFHWLERYLLSVPFQKKCDRTPSGWRIPSLWGALSRLLTGPGSQKELLRSFNFIEPSVVWNHTGVAIYIVEDLPADLLGVSTYFWNLQEWYERDDYPNGNWQSNPQSAQRGLLQTWRLAQRCMVWHIVLKDTDAVLSKVSQCPHTGRDSSSERCIWRRPNWPTKDMFFVCMEVMLMTCEIVCKAMYVVCSYIASMFRISMYICWIALPYARTLCW